jgi:hypothetical protein
MYDKNFLPQRYREAEKPIPPFEHPPGGWDLILSSFSRSEGKIYLLYGDQLVFRLSHYIGAKMMLGGELITVIDGCNRFDVHYLSRFAQQRKIDPNQFLRKVFVSRGFTCYQMESAVGGKLPAFLKRIGSRTVFIFGLLDTFYDQQAPYREVRQILERLLIKFHEMKTDGVSLLLTSMDWKVIPEERNRLFEQLKINADKVFHLTLNEEGQPKLFLESECAACSAKKLVLQRRHFDIKPGRFNFELRT